MAGRASLSEASNSKKPKLLVEHLCNLACGFVETGNGDFFFFPSQGRGSQKK